MISGNFRLTEELTTVANYSLATQQLWPQKRLYASDKAVSGNYGPQVLK